MSKSRFVASLVCILAVAPIVRFAAADTVEPAQAVATSDASAPDGGDESSVAVPRDGKVGTAAAKEDEVADLVKGGLTLQYGLAFGVSYSMLLGYMPGDETGPTQGIGGTPILSLSFFPGYWKIGHENALYCSSNPGGRQKAADEAAFERTKRANPKDPNIAGVADAAACAKNEGCQALVRSADGSDWKLGVPGRCKETRWGFYLGYPFAPTKMNVVLGSSQRFRELSGVASIGLVYSPQPFIQLQLGISAFLVQRDDGASAAAIYVPTLGIGTTLDVFSALKP